MVVLVVVLWRTANSERRQQNLWLQSAYAFYCHYTTIPSVKLIIDNYVGRGR